MADQLAQRFGTEKDRVNCPFYIKIGACRHGDRCSRHHNKPHLSSTILMPNLYVNPALNAPLGPDGLPIQVDANFVQQDYEAFYEDVFEEMTKFGKIECLNVCDNYSDHLVGNVYIKFQDEQSALNAMTALQNRYYNGKQILAEFSPVADFREATCRQYEENQCKRGGYCNFMHLKPISRDLRKHLFGRYKRAKKAEPAAAAVDRRSRRSRSPAQEPVREGSAERRARIAEWSRKRREDGTTA